MKLNWSNFVKKQEVPINLYLGRYLLLRHERSEGVRVRLFADVNVRLPADLSVFPLQTWRVDSASQSLLNTFPVSGRPAGGASSCHPAPKESAEVEDGAISSSTRAYSLVHIVLLLIFIPFFFLLSSSVFSISRLSCNRQKSPTACQRVKTHPATKMQLSRNTEC